MPFGATNAPATFQRLMEDCLGDLNMNWCILYLDDVIVYSQTPEEHLERLEAVFKKLSAYGLKLKPSKCTFFQEEITYLGHLITVDGIATDPKKIQVVKDWPTLQTVSDVRSFLGFVGYYRRFINGFSHIAKPLYQLTKGLKSQTKKTAKKTFITWGEKEEESFKTLKEACTTAPGLAYPNYSLPFILHTDSSTDGLGAVLYQKQEEGTRVIAYASRALTASEANYAPHKLEFLALKWAVTDKFKEYLYGGNWFEVYTDNNPLTYILSTAKLDACGQRWVADLANFNFTLHYKPGSTNTVADALSRIVWPDILSQQDTEEYESMPANLVQTICHGACVEALMDLCSYTGSVVPMQPHVPAGRGWSLDDWVQLQSQDPDIRVIIQGLQENTLRNRKIHHSDSATLRHYLRMQPQLELCDGVLYRKAYTANHRTRGVKLQIILPKSLIAERSKKLYDRKSRGVELLLQDLVLVKKVAWTSRHKIQDKWEEGEYVVLSRPDPYLPVYKVQPVEGGKVRTLHRNLLLPLCLQLNSDSEEESKRSTDSEFEQKDGVFKKVSGKSPKETNPLDSGTPETDIVDPLNAFTEFWELVEDNGVDGVQDSESELSEKDKQASNKGTGQSNIEDVGQSQFQTDHSSDSLSKSPPTQVPRRSTRSTKGKKPKRFGFTLNPFTAKWI